VRRSLAVVACALVALVAALQAGAGVGFGAAEDGTKYADDGGAWLDGRLLAAGLTENRITVRWDPAQPTTIQEKAFLDRSLPVSAAQGVRVVLDVYAVRAYSFATDADGRIAQFAAYLQLLARTYPQVTDFIVGNEPNEAFFWQPQFASDGAQVSAAVDERLLAASYDALKTVNPRITVIGGGPSPSGNDTTSTSPVRFIAALGRAYRASGRTRPLMDKLGFHVYPDHNTDSPSTHYAWPNASAADLDRIKQAVWDAFAGTPQPTFEGGLTFAIDEFGWQASIDPLHAHLYSGRENVPAIGEVEQAGHYADVIRTLACDPTVSDLMVFHLIDESDLGRFQSGLLRADGSERPSFDAVRAAIAAGSCSRLHVWEHTTGVVGGAATFAVHDVAAGTALPDLAATADEGAVAKAGVFRIAATGARLRRTEIERSLAGLAAQKPLLSATVLVKPKREPQIAFDGRLQPGVYVYAVRLTAETNADRTETFVSAPFRVASAS
jgi:hypothetical protein